MYMHMEFHHAQKVQTGCGSNIIGNVSRTDKGWVHHCTDNRIITLVEKNYIWDFKKFPFSMARKPKIDTFS